MRQPIAPSTRNRGITVLGLLLLIIALVIAAVFLVRYLQSRPAAATSSQVIIGSLHFINRLIS